MFLNIAGQFPLYEVGEIVLYICGHFDTYFLLLLAATVIGLGAVYNIASPDPNRTFEVWFTAIAIFNILVIISIFVQLKLKKVECF